MKISSFFKVAFVALFISSCDSSNKENTVKSPDNTHVNTIFEFPINKEQVLLLAQAKYQYHAEKLSPNKGFIRETKNNKWHQQNWKDWTDGFFPGVLWQLAIIDEKLLPLAEKWTLPLEGHKSFDSHDLGFIFNNSYGKAIRMTGESKYEGPLEFAASHLAKRYSNKVGAIRSWDFGSYQFPVIIDNMMNLDLLWFTSKQFNQDTHFQKAQSHALTTVNEHTRPDGSSYHLIDFNPDTGAVVRKRTVQGFADSSTWSRGQAWGIYGFTRTYHETNNVEFLAAAESMANFFIEQLPSDGVPAWDFSLNANQQIKDSSASAIAASALWQLSKLTKTNEKANYYQQASLTLVENLLNSDYLDIDSDKPALLKKASGNVPSDKEVETSLIYADYYFVEALMLQLNVIDTPS